MKGECKRCEFFKTKQGAGIMGICRRFPHNIEKKPTEICGEYVRDARLIRTHQPKAAGQVERCQFCGAFEGEVHGHECGQI